MLHTFVAGNQTKPMFFSITLKHQKARGFLKSSTCIEKYHQLKMAYDSNRILSAISFSQHSISNPLKHQKPESADVFKEYRNGT